MSQSCDVITTGFAEHDCTITSVVTIGYLAPFAHNTQFTTSSNINLLTYFPSVTSQSCDVITIRLPAYHFPIVPHSNHWSISSSAGATAILNFGPIFFDPPYLRSGSSQGQGQGRIQLPGYHFPIPPHSNHVSICHRLAAVHDRDRWTYRHTDIQL